ncbi:MAG: hypothetical protein ACOYM9_03385 [Bradymonadia bacterium]|jgi:hypothetical protein
MLSRFAVASAALATGLGLSACASLSHVDRAVGVCGREQDQCRARCEALSDLDERDFCREDCRRTAAVCEGRRGERAGMDVVPSVGVTEYGEAEASRVVLSEGRIDSNGPNVSFRGEARSTDAAWEVLPGGLLQVTFALPANTREAELLVDHACSGVPCFVTLSLGEKALAARYAPPRRVPGGKLHRDVWPLTPYLPAPDAKAEPGATRPWTLIIYNNAQAGSTAPWLVGKVVLYHRALAR